MAVSGLPEPCTTQARDIARLALDMMDLGRDVLVDGEPVVIYKFRNFRHKSKSKFLLNTIFHL